MRCTRAINTQACTHQQSAHAGLPGNPVLAVKPELLGLRDSNVTYGYIPGVRPGVRVHVLLSPGGCNTTVIQDVIVPDFLPPSFADVQRLESSVAAAAAQVCSAEQSCMAFVR